jgi:hypothetical protein
MTDPVAAERLAAIRRKRSPANPPRAHAAKILTTGLSTSLVLTIVAYLAHSANVSAAESVRDAKRLEVSQILAAKLFRPGRVGQPAITTTVPTSVAPAVGGAPVPVVNVPVDVPVPVPATPAPKPVQQPVHPKPAKPASTSRSSK